MEFVMTKAELRYKYQLLRDELDPEEMLRMSYQIRDHFRSLDLPSIQYLLTYSPLIIKKEFEISYCTDALLEIQPQIKLLWPVIKEVNQMEAIMPLNKQAFSFNKYHIAEPASGKKIEPLKIDLVLVPLLAFDKRGYRVGYGKGYYDRFFQRCRKDVLKIGVSYFEAAPVISDINQFDVPLNYCITPQGIYEF